MVASAILFDLDGTIWDSWPWYSRIFHSAARVTLEKVLNALRGGRSVVSLSRECGISRARFVELCREGLHELALYPGVKDTLVRLTERQVPLGIVTNLPPWLAAPCLEGKTLDHLLPIRKYAARKPNASGLIEILRKLPSVSQGDVYYVGDSDTDGETARRAGVPFVWAAYGYGESVPRDTRVVLRQFRDLLIL